MMTEKSFVLGYGAFWRSLLPMAEEYIRARNVSVDRYAFPLSSEAASNRGLINELGFLMFAHVANGSSEEELWIDESTVERLCDQARRHVQGMRQYGRKAPEALGGADIEEAMRLARRLKKFFAEATDCVLNVSPAFSGCGWLDGCRGDVLSGGTLYEVKAGERGFRTADIRQLLVYCALNFESKSHDLRAVGLVNPRLGTFMREELETLCRNLAGRSSVEVLSDVVEYLSEPLVRYSAG
ncbi:MAG: hypothetical protein U0414_19510 [Polyangiaceae bacterium]